VAAGKKNATRLNASLVFIDESGILMAPLLRRSWSPRSCTPILRQRTRSHQKVSAIAALCVDPHRVKVHLYFRLHPKKNISSLEVIEFLRQLRRHLRGALVLVWDRHMAHRSLRTKAFFNRIEKISPVLLPPYAPELNPVENFWSYLKMNPMANLAIDDIDVLADRTRNASRKIQRDETLLRSFIAHTPLSLRVK